MQYPLQSASIDLPIHCAHEMRRAFDAGNIARIAILRRIVGNLNAAGKSRYDAECEKLWIIAA